MESRHTPASCSLAPPGGPTHPQQSGRRVRDDLPRGSREPGAPGGGPSLHAR
ncbi:hypothetical protein EYF80_064159 [Liparis tanakae]|uniref:Uncharacterized protein n=1 Tax=Liparis tanakae TaxID=230148 RepID=A0A4Z2EA71_9TELE|nr:hypothetical protein EYF80_064159 [Liparis tanakae]